MCLDSEEKLKSVKGGEEEEGVRKELQQARKRSEELREKEAEIDKKERLAPWNVDTLSKPGFEKTVINKSKLKVEDTAEDKAQKTVSFVDKYEDQIKKFGMLRDYNASRDYLRDNSHLVCEETASYLTLWCVNLEVQQKSALMERVAHQTIVMQYVLELAKQLQRDPRSCMPTVFERMKSSDRQTQEAFEDELSSFISRVKKRAQAKVEDAMKEYEEEERKKRLGPGGLDPLEVMETLPDSLRECFESKSIAKLHEVLASLTAEDASYHMQRCIDSGLWVADARSAGLTPASEALQKELGEKQEQEQEVEMASFPTTPEDEKEDSGEHYEDVD